MEKREKELNETDEILKTLYGESGELSETKVKELIQSYIEVQKNASKVYVEVTGGLLSKPHYSAETVIQIYLDRKNQMIDKTTVCDDMVHIISDEPTKEIVKEYFNRVGE